MAVRSVQVSESSNANHRKLKEQRKLLIGMHRAQQGQGAENSRSGGKELTNGFEVFDGHKLGLLL